MNNAEKIRTEQNDFTFKDFSLKLFLIQTKRKKDKQKVNSVEISTFSMVCLHKRYFFCRKLKIFRKRKHTSFEVMVSLFGT